MDAEDQLYTILPVVMTCLTAASSKFKEGRTITGVMFIRLEVMFYHQEELRIW